PAQLQRTDQLLVKAGKIGLRRSQQTGVAVDAEGAGKCGDICRRDRLGCGNPAIQGYGTRHRRAACQGCARQTSVEFSGMAIAPDSLTDDDEAMILAAVRDLVRDKVAPRAAEIDATGELPGDIQKRFAQ